jgi:hypothetical protein
MGADQGIVIQWHESLVPIEKPNLVRVLLVPVTKNQALTPHQAVGMPPSMSMSMSMSMPVAMMLMSMDVSIASRILMGITSMPVAVTLMVMDVSIASRILMGIMSMPVAMMLMAMDVSIASRILMGMLTAAVFLLLFLFHSNQHLLADREPQWLCDAAYEPFFQGHTS